MTDTITLPREVVERVAAILSSLSSGVIYYEPEENDGKIYDDEHLIADWLEVGVIRQAATTLSELEKEMKK